MGTTQAEEFTSALADQAPSFGTDLSAGDVSRLRDYYELLLTWNPRLHLVAPCSPAEFAARHALESLIALPFLREGAHVLDVGSGAGLPIVPCLAAREDLRATLFEASPKKAVFLREALRAVGAHKRARVVAERFEQTQAPAADALTCRALDRFAEMFTALVRWSPPACTLLLFGGDSIRERIADAALAYEEVRVPRSQQRYLFVVRRV